MSFSSGVQHLRVDPAAVVADDNLQQVTSIFQFNFDAAGSGVPKRID
jgi:hypothetical protein